METNRTKQDFQITPSVQKNEMPFAGFFRKCLSNQAQALDSLSMSELKSLPAHLTGGNFLLAETDPTLLATPEDLSSEQRLMAQTAQKFMEKEVMPNLEALE